MVQKFLVLALVFLAALGATLFYLARDAGHGESMGRGGSERSGEARELVPGSSSQIRLSEEDLGRLVVNSLTDHPNGERLLEVAKEVRAQLEDGRVELGMVVNLGDVRGAELSDKEREAVEKVARYLPFLEDKDLYLAVSGRPAIQDGKVTVEDDLKIKLAFLSVPVGEFADTLGFDPSELQERLAIDLRPFVATAVEVVDGELLISVGT
ncbi:MAG: hypothetical protein OES47_05080 [Acidobacteriota bacterium]|nr:hypothetical protein [Acidobacteriota bacterium]